MLVPLATRAFALLLLACYLMAGLPVHAEAVKVDTATRAEITHQIEYFEDSELAYDIDSILFNKILWQRHENQVFNKSYSTSAWWLKIHFENTASYDQQRLLEINYAILDRVDVFVYSHDGLVSEFQTGDLLPFKSRPIDSTNFVFPLEWQKGQTSTVYIRIETDTAVQAPLILWDKISYANNVAITGFMQGLYIGSILVLVAYNLMVLLSLRDRIYLYYIFFIASSPVVFAAITGIGFQYLWRDAIAWNTLATPVPLAIMLVAGNAFTREFLQIKQWASGWNKTYKILIAISSLLLIVSFLLPYKIILLLLLVMIILSCSLDLTLGFTALYRNVPQAKYYVLAWSILLVGSVIYCLSKLNILPVTFATEHSVQIGSILEAILLSFALADRINIERRLRMEAQEDSLRIQREVNEDLERRVDERTSELATLNQKLEALSNTDALTGVGNRRFLETMADKEWQRALRSGKNYSVIMVDIDHFKKINDRYGHGVGDECICGVATILRRLMRNASDIVARYGGEEFCLVLPETDSDGALKLAERINKTIANTPLFIGKEEIQITASLGVCSESPSQQRQLKHVFASADEALYQSKAEGRNRVTLHKG